MGILTLVHAKTLSRYPDCKELDCKEEFIWQDSLAGNRWCYLPQLLEIILRLWDLTEEFIWY